MVNFTTDCNLKTTTPSKMAIKNVSKTSGSKQVAIKSHQPPASSSINNHGMK
jgi:hypothetical protein